MKRMWGVRIFFHECAWNIILKVVTCGTNNEKPSVFMWYVLIADTLEQMAFSYDNYHLLPFALKFVNGNMWARVYVTIWCQTGDKIESIETQFSKYSTMPQFVLVVSHNKAHSNSTSWTLPWIRKLSSDTSNVPFTKWNVMPFLASHNPHIRNQEYQHHTFGIPDCGVLAGVKIW